jgi:hypothetical protein
MDLQSIAFDHSATFPNEIQNICLGKEKKIRKRWELNPHNRFSKPVTQTFGTFPQDIINSGQNKHLD